MFSENPLTPGALARYKGQWGTLCTPSRPVTDHALTLPALGRPASVLPRRLLTDQQLADIAGTGDERAFATLYERHVDGLYRYAFSLLGNDADASDAMQTAMMNALLALPAKKPAVPLKPWLYRIAHNEAITIVRRRRIHDDIADHENGTGGAGNPHEELALREDVRRLVDDMLELPERQRAALIMRELNGLEYAEIGAAFDVSEGAARQLVYEGRGALHERERGRELACETVRRTISAGDRRVLRGRRVKAHLRACTDCRDFDVAIGRRRAGLEALVPGLPGISLVAFVKGLFGGSGGGGGGVLGGGVAAGGAAGGAVAVPALVKTAFVAAALVAGAVPTVELVERVAGDRAGVRNGGEVALAARTASAPPLIAPSRLAAGETTLLAPVQLRPAPRGEERGGHSTPGPLAPAQGVPVAQVGPEEGARPDKPAGDGEVNGVTEESAPNPKPNRRPKPVKGERGPVPVPAPVAEAPPVLQAPGSGTVPPGHAKGDKPGKKPHPHGGPPGLLPD